MGKASRAEANARGAGRLVTVRPFDGTAATSVARLEAYLAEALACAAGSAFEDADQVPVEHVPPPADSCDLVLGDLRLLLGRVTELENQVHFLTP